MNTLSKQSLVVLLISSLWLQSCEPTKYYSSINDGIQSSYIAMPLVKDSVKTALYGGLSIISCPNTANNGESIFSTKANIYKTWLFGTHGQAYIGADAGLGRYRVYDDEDELNPKTFNNSFGNIGLHGGINFVVPFEKIDWRVIGLEFSTNQEFGNHLRYRKKLSQVSGSSYEYVVATSPNFTTIGLTTEITGKFGFKWAAGYNLNNKLKEGGDDYPIEYGRFYSQIFFHYTFDKNSTIYFQYGGNTLYITPILKFGYILRLK